MLQRLALNLFAGWMRLPSWFPQQTMHHIRDVIAEGERGHAGELCLAIESRYSLWEVFAGLGRAVNVSGIFEQRRIG